jgi:hypothetical protein
VAFREDHERVDDEQSIGVDRTAAAVLGMTAVVGLRLASILWGLRLPVFLVPEERKKTK